MLLTGDNDSFELFRDKTSHENNLSMFTNGNSLSNIADITYKRHKPESSFLGRKKRRELFRSVGAGAHLRLSVLKADTQVNLSRKLEQ